MKPLKLGRRPDALTHLYRQDFHNTAFEEAINLLNRPHYRTALRFNPNLRALSLMRINEIFYRAPKVIADHLMANPETLFAEGDPARQSDVRTLARWVHQKRFEAKPVLASEFFGVFAIETSVRNLLDRSFAFFFADENPVPGLNRVVSDRAVLTSRWRARHTIGTIISFNPERDDLPAMIGDWPIAPTCEILFPSYTFRPGGDNKPSKICNAIETAFLKQCPDGTVGYLARTFENPEISDDNKKYQIWNGVFLDKRR